MSCPRRAREAVPAGFSQSWGEGNLGNWAWLGQGLGPLGRGHPGPGCAGRDGTACLGAAPEAQPGWGWHGRIEARPEQSGVVKAFVDSSQEAASS